jgi:ABC-2 type transport system permease protein
MIAAAPRRVVRRRGVVAELLKLPAFFRRDMLTASSDRLTVLSELASVSVGVAMFALFGRMINPDVLPSFGGHKPSYMEFAAVGIVLGAFIQVGLARVSVAIQGEQARGTLESLLTTPTATPTIFLGSVMYDLVYVPLRTCLMLAGIVLLFGLDYQAAGVLPAALYLLAFLPFVWGLGMANAAFTLTFRRGAGVFTIAVTLVTIGSGVYFPLSILPEPAAAIAPFNPIWIVAEGMRESLIAGDWSALDLKILTLPLLSLCSLVFGLAMIRLALRRERERGSLALY